MHALLVVNLKGTDVIYLCRMLILLLFIFYFILGMLCRHRFYGAEVIYHLSSWMEFRTLSQMCGRLYVLFFSG